MHGHPKVASQSDADVGRCRRKRRNVRYMRPGLENARAQQRPAPILPDPSGGLPRVRHCVGDVRCVYVFYRRERMSLKGRARDLVTHHVKYASYALSPYDQAIRDKSISSPERTLCVRGLIVSSQKVVDGPAWTEWKRNNRTRIEN